jgi:hypothetical protein
MYPAYRPIFSAVVRIYLFLNNINLSVTIINKQEYVTESYSVVESSVEHVV